MMTQCLSKTCFKCGQYKPLSEFYCHPQSADGYLNKCKTCTKEDAKANYRKHHMDYLIYEHMPTRIRSRRIRASSKDKIYRLMHPERYHARIILNNAVRDRKIVKQPCAICGCQKVEAHHVDYSKPLDVEWLCHLHHRQKEDRLIYK